jgi:hypothetical protein
MTGPRRGHLPPCEVCGRRTPLMSVPVVSRTGEMRAVFSLCPRCRDDPRRAWRLRWCPESEAA